jgi:hypothetical protein
MEFNVMRKLFQDFELKCHSNEVDQDLLIQKEISVTCLSLTISCT